MRYRGRQYRVASTLPPWEDLEPDIQQLVDEAGIFDTDEATEQLRELKSVYLQVPQDLRRLDGRNCWRGAPGAPAIVLCRLPCCGRVDTDGPRGGAVA